ncbi:a26cf322-68f1-45ee-8dcc-c245eb767368 [Sclerotinia trifoliorum]|uniref:A26cf322-68f1-45ee-8dcc-c245eb767368 n=1 Tax=Sclerotinia trifoliorum TaxID=28548 RepID=A0A8H2VV87_9HELO|nr:a26cf322-68f1-45ee-8dcc-c245eb767368 [Sclerotinia trifoliorum]
MSGGCHGPQQLKDRIMQSRVHHEHDQFIETIREDDFCLLASSSYHNADLCGFFKSPARDSYNICYFVHFTSENSNEEVEKWVVRVPLAWHTGAKLGSRQCCYNAEFPYGQLRDLSDEHREHLCTSLVDIHIQLRGSIFLQLGV